MDEKKHIRWISYVKIIGIILVVLGHSFHEYPDGVNGVTFWLYKFIYSFHMPLFVFISGMVLSNSCKNKNCLEKYSKFSRAKFKQLLIPFFILGIGVFPFRAIMSFCADDNVILSSVAFFDSLLYSDKLSIPFFWFLPMIYICQLIGYAVCKMKNTIIFISLFLFAILLHFYNYLGGMSLFSINYVGVYLTYFVMGMFCGNNLFKFRNIVKWHSPYLLILTIFGWAVSYYLNSNIINSNVMAFVCAICGIFMTISVACALEHYKIKILDHLNGATYMIFLLSWFFNVGSQQVLHHFFDFPWQIYSIISIVTSIYIPLYIYRYLTHNTKSGIVNILAWTLGHKSRLSRRAD